MNRSNDNRSKLPSVEQILKTLSIHALIEQWGRSTIAQAIRELQREQRKLSALETWATNPDEYDTHLENWTTANLSHGYTTVFNLTGTVIHTNLGRSLLSEAIMSMTHMLNLSTRKNGKYLFRIQVLHLVQLKIDGQLMLI